MANPNPKRENLTAPRYKKGSSGNPKGRPKSRVPLYKVNVLGLKKAKHTPDMDLEELREWYETLLTFNLQELKLLAAEETAPALARAYARAMIYDMNAGHTYTVDRITARLFGKAVQRIEHTGADGADLHNPRTLSKSEVAELWKKPEKYDTQQTDRRGYTFRK